MTQPTSDRAIIRKSEEKIVAEIVAKTYRNYRKNYRNYRILVIEITD